MKTITATELEESSSEFFEALATEGKVILTRNGREFPVKLVMGNEKRMTKVETSRKISSAFMDLANSIPENQRETVGIKMTDALEAHRAEVRAQRIAERNRKSNAVAE